MSSSDPPKSLDDARRRIIDLEKENAYYRKHTDELAGHAITVDSQLSRTKRLSEQRKQGLALLSELEKIIYSDLDAEEILDRALSTVRNLLKMDRVVGLLPSKNRECFHPVVHLGFEDEVITALKDAEVQFSPELLAPGAHLLSVKTTEETAPLLSLREKLGFPYFVCVPVLSNQQPEAMLIIGRTREQKPFYPPLDEGDVHTLQSVAGFVGNAFENASLYRSVENMARSFARFVPQEFLTFLGRERLEDAQLGDQVQREMTVLFSDIRGFTNISENMSPKENFDFINDYLSHVAPAIRQNGGFIDKYIGDAIMALFPHGADTGLRAAIALQEAVRGFNSTLGPKGISPLRVGAGIHSGVLMLGMIGFKERMEGTVISDSVNLSSRIEGLTKLYGASILISSDTLSRLSHPEEYDQRWLDLVQVKGKEKPIGIIEVFAGDDEDQRKRKSATASAYSNGFEAYKRGDFKQALKEFRAVRKENPADKAALLQQKRCEIFIRDGKPENWTGVAMLTVK